MARVIMGVNAEVLARNMQADFAHNALNFIRQCAAVGVAQRHPAGARCIGRSGDSQRIMRVGAVAIKEMLAVNDDLTAIGHGDLHAFADVIEVFIQRAAQRRVHVEIPGFRNIGNGVGFCCQQARDTGII